MSTKESLVKYDTPVQQGTLPLKDTKKGKTQTLNKTLTGSLPPTKSGKLPSLDKTTTSSAQQQTLPQQTEDLLNSIIPPRYFISLFLLFFYFYFNLVYVRISPVSFLHMQLLFV